MDTGERRFKCGMQVERGYLRAPREMRACQLRSDWDWQRLVQALTPRGTLITELKRLVAEEFEVHAGSWSSPHTFRKTTLPGAARIRALLDAAPPREWCGFQVYFALGEEDVRAMNGTDLIETMMAVFEEVKPAMNECMQVRLR